MVEATYHRETGADTGAWGAGRESSLMDGDDSLSSHLSPPALHRAREAMVNSRSSHSSARVQVRVCLVRASLMSHELNDCVRRQKQVRVEMSRPSTPTLIQATRGILPPPPLPPLTSLPAKEAARPPAETPSYTPRPRTLIQAIPTAATGRTRPLRSPPSLI